MKTIRNSGVFTEAREAAQQANMLKPTPDREQPAVSRELDRLLEALQELEETIGVMASTLQPVLRQDESVPEDPCNQAVRAEKHCTVSYIISDRIDWVYRLVAVVSHLHGRLEV